LESASWLHSLEELLFGLCDINLHPLMTALEGSTSLKKLRLQVNAISMEGGYKLPSLENLQELNMYTEGGIALFKSIYDVCLPSITMMEFHCDPSTGEARRAGRVAWMNFERVLFNDMPRLREVNFDAPMRDYEWADIVSAIPKHIGVGRTVLYTRFIFVITMRTIFKSDHVCVHMWKKVRTLMQAFFPIFCVLAKCTIRQM
jgi:hypothetical protein